MPSGGGSHDLLRAEEAVQLREASHSARLFLSPGLGARGLLPLLARVSAPDRCGSSVCLALVSSLCRGANANGKAQGEHQRVVACIGDFLQDFRLGEAETGSELDGA